MSLRQSKTVWWRNPLVSSKLWKNQTLKVIFVNNNKKLRPYHPYRYLSEWSRIGENKLEILKDKTMDDKLMYVPIGYKQTGTNDHIKFCSKKGDAFIFFYFTFHEKIY